MLKTGRLHLKAHLFWKVRRLDFQEPSEDTILIRPQATSGIYYRMPALDLRRITEAYLHEELPLLANNTFEPSQDTFVSSFAKTARYS